MAGRAGKLPTHLVLWAWVALLGAAHALLALVAAPLLVAVTRRSSLQAAESV